MASDNLPQREMRLATSERNDTDLPSHAVARNERPRDGYAGLLVSFLMLIAGVVLWMH